MKALDYFLIVCMIVLLCSAYYLVTIDHFRSAGIVNLIAYAGSVVLSARIGGKYFKKNQENKE